ncbi:AAA domain-containing protein [Pseudorhodoferax soli]|uniref:Nuclease-like protein n=1 Tax=Pseudorhodoferax soli TaxID=545864 RepID=A0A368XB24_9BURK|nr:AAA domain-containing protein [Pseudorhodoferax soli]RCW65162.1 nuclease-like protein [Pseudorhodoferax soli]
MRINYLSARGVLEVEHATLRELETKLPDTWGAYAAFRLLTRGSKLPLDIDLLLLTTNRILVVELKNWSGDIEYSSGQWFHRGYATPSPVEVTDNKVRALKSFIREKYPTMKIPFIETLVVLCHPKCRLVRFPDEQRRFVSTLNEFVHVATDVGRYKKRFPDTPPNFLYRSADPLQNRQQYNAIFSSNNPAVLRRRTVLYGFEQIDDHADYVHPRKIWSEFLAEHQESRSSKALLRKWNFEVLAAGGTSTVERQTIGLRELRLNEQLRVQASDLHEDLLEPIGSATADDITTNFVEAYRLPAGIERLGEHLARNADMDELDRRALAKSILARFSKLHALGIAHRDITRRTLWVLEPSRVILSTFAAARVPQAHTVGVHRIELETGSIDLPEDGGGRQEARTTDAFARDAFLLGVLVYELMEGRELERRNQVPVYDGTATLNVPALAPWYAQAMSLDPAARYRSASDALDALNACLAVEFGPDICEADFDGYDTTASPMTLQCKRMISPASTKTVYESERDGVRVLVKCWPQLKYDQKYPARNLRLLAFLQQARSLRQSGFDASPEVLDFGLSPFGLMLVTRWIEGSTLAEWLEANSDGRLRAMLALALLNAVRRLHVLGLSHGDVKADNIVVPQTADGEAPGVVLVDIPDLSADGDEGITIGAVPPALEGASPLHRDAFAVCALVLDLIPEEFSSTRSDIARALDLVDTPPPLDLLAETLQDELHPKSRAPASFKATLKRRGRGGPPSLDLISNHGEFSVRATLHAETGHVRFYVVGTKQELYIMYDPAQEAVLDAAVKEIDHIDFVSAFRRKNFTLNAEIQVAFGEEHNADTLAGLLFQLYRARVPDDLEAGGSTDGRARDPYARQADAALLHAMTARAFWTALADTDEMNVTTITVRTGVKQVPPGSGEWLIPYDCEGGVLDFTEGETIELLERRLDVSDGNERWFTIGRVSPDLGRDLMKVRSKSMLFAPKPGDTLHVRGTFEKVGSERRVAAMKRVLAGGGLIPSLVDFFDPEVERAPQPDASIVLEDLGEYELNASQEEALRTALSFGPISLLQGPPGTGKTKFIASFVHLLLSRGLAGNILLVSQSHEAVNNAMLKVSNSLRASRMEVPMVRVGLPSMVSPGLRSIQEDALRQRYRESFDAEVKERVRAVGVAMGLPPEYVRTATDLHITLGPLMQGIERLTLAVEEGEGGDTSAAEHLKRLGEVFAEVAARQFGIEAPPSANDVGHLKALLEAKLDELATQNGSPSPSKRARLEQIARLSTEFAQVLRNPRSNYTSFLARSSKIVAGTCVGVGKQALGITEVPYDWVIVDEAARASPMELVVAMQAGKRVLLVGDHLQLPPSYPRAVEEQASALLGVSRKDFRRINNFQRAFSSKYGKSVGRTLRVQYRMAEHINRLVSHCFYADALEVGRKPPGDEYAMLPDFLASQVVWIDTQDQARLGFHRAAGTHEGALVNEAEAAAVVDVVRAILTSTDFIQEVMEERRDDEPIIGIIAMYAAQRDLIRRKLEQADWASKLRDQFTVGTVDSYQGKENRIIVLSVVRNDTNENIGFLADPERINVAMSRAKDRLVIVSSSSMWRTRTSTPMKRVLDEVERLADQGNAQFVPSKDLKRSIVHA